MARKTNQQCENDFAEVCEIGDFRCTLCGDVLPIDDLDWDCYDDDEPVCSGCAGTRRRMLRDD